MIEIDCYRITTDRWHRGWQAEWEGCQTAPRAWTRKGVERKAICWAVLGTDRRKAERRHRNDQVIP